MHSAYIVIFLTMDSWTVIFSFLLLLSKLKTYIVGYLIIIFSVHFFFSMWTNILAPVCIFPVAIANTANCHRWTLSKSISPHIMHSICSSSMHIYWYETAQQSNARNSIYDAFLFFLFLFFFARAFIPFGLIYLILSNSLQWMRCHCPRQSFTTQMARCRCFTVRVLFFFFLRTHKHVLLHLRLFFCCCRCCCIVHILHTSAEQYMSISAIHAYLCLEREKKKSSNS